MSQFTSGTFQTLGLAMKLLQPGCICISGIVFKKDQEDVPDIIRCHFYVILKVWARLMSCGYREGTALLKSDDGPWVRSWTFCSELKWSGPGTRDKISV